MGNGRDALLAAAVDTVVQRGLADLSLRALADEIGTSHRMLIYHFGSKEGLVTDVVKEIDRRLYATAWPEAAARADDPAAASRAVWREVSSEERRPEQVLMVEMYVAAMRGRPGTGELAAHLGDWVAASESQAGWLEGDAHRQSRLLAAVVRGLLLDLLMTGERDEVDDAFERFLELAALDPRMP
ncbi:MAG: TetR/AcrR family transcriptional regulator [Actinobacteria bacterium]|nr:TetR/AcrR family transcriptional regulator [Actinomycetota bacterium]